MASDLDPVRPSAALRALAKSFIEAAPREPLFEVRIKVRDTNLNVRDFSTYLALLDGVYGRFDLSGFRSYARQPERQLNITRIENGSIDLTFLFDLVNEFVSYRGLLLYIIVRVGPALLRGEVAKNWAEAAKASVETYRAVRPSIQTEGRASLSEKKPDVMNRSETPLNDGEVGELFALVPHGQPDRHSPVKFTHRQRKQLRAFIKDDPRLSRLSDRHRKQLVDLIEQVLSQERHHLPGAIRFSEQYVVEVTFRRLERPTDG